MDRNYHGAARIARMIRSAHVLIRLKSDIPLKRTSQICPTARTGRSCRHGVTVPVRVIEYWVTVEGQEVPEMFCLVTDLMDWEDYPGPEPPRSKMAVGRIGDRAAGGKAPLRGAARHGADARSGYVHACHYR